MKKILRDINFENGFKISHIDSINHHNDTINWRYKLKPISWKLCQWCSKYSLLDNRKTEKGDNTFRLYNEQKDIIRNADNSLTLSIQTDKEYSSPRKDGESWPHLLIEQSFKKIKICELTNLHAYIDFDFVNFKNHMQNSGELHTFQVTWYFSITDFNKKSKGYKDFFWFGLPFIDTPRLPMGKPYEAADTGKEDCTSKYIISLNPNQWIKKPTEPGDKFIFDGDILPELKKAFMRAKEKGYLKNSKFEDMYLSSTNFGIEDTGTFDGTIKVNKINIYEK